MAERLAGVLGNLTKHEDSIMLYKRVLDAQERKLGPDSEDTLLTVTNLAYAYYLDGEFEAAEPLFERAMTGLEKLLGPDHPYVAQSAHNFSLMREKQGRMDQATVLAAKAVAAAQKSLPDSHVQRAAYETHLASLRASGSR
ncbi:tetratricopeptide repeat protein [Verrucomicrobium spinosum]|uniref:tetratricopeptide repeat protein n=1 Tax=Verrucomicrobium spinosum TaxID=2736 RepID=UPI0009462016|nr:tetratricopeptide repeat protein [Verrucomicrobium spinosum]